MATKNYNSITMTDVANRAKVSQATVSRVLNRHPSINEKTRQLVHKAIEELGYKATPLSRRPSAHGINSAKLCFGLLMCSLDEQANPLSLSFFSTIVEGIDKVAKINNFEFNFMTVKASTAHEKIDFTTLKKLSGIIVMGSPSDDLIAAMNKHKLKFVVVSSDRTDLDSDMVIADSIEAGIRAAKYLLSEGKTRIGYIATEHDEERLDGLQIELGKKNITIAEKDRKLVESTDVCCFLECIHNWIAEGDLPEVIVVSFIDAALMVKKVLELNGINVPGDVELFSYCHSDNSNTDITCMQIFPRLIGEKAANRLLELIRNPEDIPHKIVIPMQLVKASV